jgi:hypothetical protein
MQPLKTIQVTVKEWIFVVPFNFHRNQLIAFECANVIDFVRNRFALDAIDGVVSWTRRKFRRKTSPLMFPPVLAIRHGFPRMFWWLERSVFCLSALQRWLCALAGKI